VAIHAQRKAEDRQEKARERHPLKNKKVYSYVLEKLREGWSPELIAGRLKDIERPNDPSWHICHETIYQFIYAKENKKLALWEYLPRKQKKRRKQRGTTVYKSLIPQRASISKRSDKANNREEFGHWEGDKEFLDILPPERLGG
jgi:transposase, IS30 family